VSAFTLALPLAAAIGAPLSTAILTLNGVWGLAGWQWMFLAEATPSVLLGVVAMFYLTDRPAEARWLSDAERSWLTSTLDEERRQIEAHGKIGLLRSLWEPKVLLLSLNFLGIVTASLGMLLFLPQIVKQLGLSNMQVGWASMIPYLCASISMVAWGWVSDRMGERRWNLFFACIVAAIGLVVAGRCIGSYWSLVGMSMAAVGLYGTKGPFWAIPSIFLTGLAAAASFAWINSIGNLGGFLGPSLVGWVKDSTGSFSAGLYALAAFALMSAVISALWLDIRRPAVAPEFVRTAAG
jgi:MFS transporter, ACS family, tartrate transporter